MGRHMRIVAVSYAVTIVVTGCSLNDNHLSFNHPAKGAPQSVTIAPKVPAHPSNQTENSTTNANEGPPSAPQSATDSGFVSFQLNRVQLDKVQQALARINVSNPNDMVFFGATVLSPHEVPQGTQLNDVISGGQAGYPMYVSFLFTTFTLTLLNQSPIFSDMKKVGTTQINGSTATWYTRSTPQQTLYFLEYTVKGTHVSFTAVLKNITQSQLETVAKSLTGLHV